MQPLWDRYRPITLLRFILYYIYYILFCKTLIQKTNFIQQQGLLLPVAEVQADGKGNDLLWDLPLLQGQDQLWKCWVLI